MTTVYNLEALVSSPSATDTLAVLSEAMRARNVPPLRRAIAAEDSRSPQEGLALLRAYIAIKDVRVRQAVLDAVLAISEADPDP
jgi:hypothetical protein